MKISRIFILFAFAFIALSWFSETKIWKKTKVPHIPPSKKKIVLNSTVKEKLQQKAAESKIFVLQNGYNSRFCFLIDMGLPSGQSRFYIFNLQKDSVEMRGLVAHGNCFEYWLEGRRYSNVVGSGCTSLGKYKIGTSYTGKWGYSYKLHGLDSTNSNAFERTVVLHSHSCVPETGTTDEICQSNGCPTVSPGMLLKLKAIINNSKKPLLLWIYD